jgi:hypothetical protein
MRVVIVAMLLASCGSGSATGPPTPNATQASSTAASAPFGDHTRRLALAFWPEVSGDENFVFSPVAASFLLQELVDGAGDPPSEALAAALPELASEPDRRALASSMSRTIDAWTDWPVVPMAMIQHGVFLGRGAHPPPRSRGQAEPPRWLKYERFRVARPESLTTDAVEWLSAPRRRPSRLTAPAGGAELVHVVSLIAGAPWEDRFDEEDTLPRSFHRLDGSSVLLPTMSTYLGHVAQRREESATCLSIPLMTRGLEKADLALTIVQPTPPTTLEELERSMDASSLSGWLSGWPSRPRHDEHLVRLPRISLSASFDVCERFEAARSLCPRGPGANVAALQHTDLDIDERGVLLRPPHFSVGRAYLGDGSDAPVVVDRPFLFVVHDRISQAILFMGRVVDPSRP